LNSDNVMLAIVPLLYTTMSRAIVLFNLQIELVNVLSKILILDKTLWRLEPLTEQKFVSILI